MTILAQASAAIERRATRRDPERSGVGASMASAAAAFDREANRPSKAIGIALSLGTPSFHRFPPLIADVRMSALVGPEVSLSGSACRRYNSVDEGG